MICDKVTKTTGDYRIGYSQVSDPSSFLWIAGMIRGAWTNGADPEGLIQYCLPNNMDFGRITHDDGTHHCFWRIMDAGFSGKDVHVMNRTSDEDIYNNVSYWERSGGGLPRGIMRTDMVDISGWEVHYTTYSKDHVLYIKVDTKGDTAWRCVVEMEGIGYLNGEGYVLHAYFDAGTPPVLVLELENGEFVAIAMQGMTTEHFAGAAWQDPKSAFNTSVQERTTQQAFCGLGRDDLDTGGDSFTIAVTVDPVEATAITRARAAVTGGAEATALTACRTMWDAFQAAATLPEGVDEQEEYYIRCIANQLYSHCYAVSATSYFLPASTSVQQLHYLRDSSRAATGLSYIAPLVASYIMRFYAETALGSLVHPGNADWWYADGTGNAPSSSREDDALAWFMLGIGTVYNNLPTANKDAFRLVMLDRLNEALSLFESLWNETTGHFENQPHHYHDWTDDSIDHTDLLSVCDEEIYWIAALESVISLYAANGDTDIVTNITRYATKMRSHIEDYATADGGLAYGLKDTGAIHQPDDLVYVRPNLAACIYLNRYASWKYLYKHNRQIARANTFFPICSAITWDSVSGRTNLDNLPLEWNFAFAEKLWGSGEDYRALIRQYVFPGFPRDVVPNGHFGEWMVGNGSFPYTWCGGEAIEMIYRIKSRTALGTSRVVAPAVIASTAGVEVTQTVADLDAGNKFAASGDDLVIVYNSGADDHRVTVEAMPDLQGRVVGVDKFSVGAGGVAILGPYDVDGWRQSDGYIYLTGDSDELKFGVVRLGG